MISRERIQSILRLAVPIICGMLSQIGLNLVDTMMVGSLGATALAAVGLGSVVNFIAVAGFIGLANGVQTFVAHRVGAGREREAATPLNAGLLITFGLGVPLAAVLVWLAPELFRLLNDDERVIRAGVPYLRANLTALAIAGAHYCFRGYLMGIQKAQVYLLALLVTHLLNIALNWVLIFGKLGMPALGVLGSGIATACSLVVGLLALLLFSSPFGSQHGLLRIAPSMTEIRDVAKLSLPNSLEQMLFGAGFTTLFWIVGKVGTAELGAAHVIVNVSLVAIMPSIGFGISAGALVSQALGRGDARDAHQWGLDVAKVAASCIAIVALPMALAPQLLLSAFIHEANVLELAAWPLRLVGLGIVIDAAGLVLMYALQGTGATRQAMLVSVFYQWGLFLPVAWLLAAQLGMGLATIWFAQMAYRVAMALTFWVIWQRRAWTRARVSGLSGFEEAVLER